MRWYEKKFRSIRTLADEGSVTWDPTTLNALMIAIREIANSAIIREERATDAAFNNSISSDSVSGSGTLSD